MTSNGCRRIIRLILGIAFSQTATCLFAADDDRPAEQVFVRSYDGAYIPAAWNKPPGDGPFPAILYIHGGVGGSGPEAATRMLQGRVPRHFAEKGYVGFATDYRRFHFGEDEIRDVLAAYRKLASLPFVDSQRIAVIGGSHGGYLAQMLASRIRPAATVSFAGLSDIKGMFYEAGLELRDDVKDWNDWLSQLLNHRDRARGGTERIDDSADSRRKRSVATPARQAMKWPWS